MIEYRSTANTGSLPSTLSGHVVNVRAVARHAAAASGAAGGARVYHAGTALSKSGHVVTSGGRVLAVTGVGGSLRAAA